MEGGNQSSSSLTSDLFEAKDSSLASSPVSSSISTTLKIHEQQSLPSSKIEKKNDSGSQSWSAKSGGVSDKNIVGSEGQSQGTMRDDMSWYFQEEKVKPFHYDSSIYYGCQDFYSPPQSAQKAQNPDHPKFNKDVEEQDPAKASRGNWWMGSVYY